MSQSWYNFIPNKSQKSARLNKVGQLSVVATHGLMLAHRYGKRQDLTDFDGAFFRPATLLAEGRLKGDRRSAVLVRQDENEDLGVFLNYGKSWRMCSLNDSDGSVAWGNDCQPLSHGMSCWDGAKNPSANVYVSLVFKKYQEEMNVVPCHICKKPARSWQYFHLPGHCQVLLAVCDPHISSSDGWAEPIPLRYSVAKQSP